MDDKQLIASMFPNGQDITFEALKKRLDETLKTQEGQHVHKLAGSPSFTDEEITRIVNLLKSKR